MADLRKPMTEAEKRLFKEAVIKEYRLKHKEETRKQFTDKLVAKLRALIPFEIIIGVIASAILIHIEGWMSFVHMLLFGVIWATIISAIMSFIVKTG